MNNLRERFNWGGGLGGWRKLCCCCEFSFLFEVRLLFCDFYLDHIFL